MRLFDLLAVLPGARNHVLGKVLTNTARSGGSSATRYAICAAAMRGIARRGGFFGGIALPIGVAGI